jgi:hypothetical protein
MVDYFRSSKRYLYLTCNSHGCFESIENSIEIPSRLAL